MVNLTKSIATIARNLIPSETYSSAYSIFKLELYYEGLPGVYQEQYNKIRQHSEIYYKAYMAFKANENGTFYKPWKLSFTPHKTDNENYKNNYLSQDLLIKLHKYYVNPKRPTESGQNKWAFNVHKVLNDKLTIQELSSSYVF